MGIKKKLRYLKNWKKGVVLLLMVATVFLIVTYVGPINMLTTSTRVPNLSWKGIAPGIATDAEVINLLGEPDYVKHHLTFTVYEYNDRALLNWDSVEIWLEQRRLQRIVVGLLRAFPESERSERSNQPTDIVPTLGEIVDTYGFPDIVTWSTSTHIRFMVWASQGIAGASPVPHSQFCYDWKECQMLEIVLFEPMKISVFRMIPWPHTYLWWSEKDLSPIDARDGFLKNPYWISTTTP